MDSVTQIGWLLLIGISMGVVSIVILSIKAHGDQRTTEESDDNICKYARDVCLHELVITKHKVDIGCVTLGVRSDSGDTHLYFHRNHPNFERITSLAMYQRIKFKHHETPHKGAKRCLGGYEPTVYMELIQG